MQPRRVEYRCFVHSQVHHFVASSPPNVLPFPGDKRVATIATEAGMTTIPHRELRNQSSKILERVKNGETIEVTNNGEVAAVLIPPSSSPFERLLLAGQIRRAAPGAVDFQSLPRVGAASTTAEILGDVRGDR
ncbi:hypothetical protein NicSoilB8_10670 [Arthrobacter sp. NicSoilB8]|nr:hypothetical protein NicSoilB8_10670 [Arthrobacter sp. NicSoilB8]